MVIAGYQKKNAILTDKEKCIVAYHEIGHALVVAMQSHSAPVQKITIIPRTSSALWGHTMQVDEGEHYLMSRGRDRQQDRHPHRRPCWRSRLYLTPSPPVPPTTLSRLPSWPGE